ncbi:hypothetical protein ACR9YC_12980 [Parasphingorhabdus sp. DH2-15]|uniref:hypothetical protein n=1 Tax=Parasphingorhabdus sp. DH2-15 TaxID=3444112 RepID=UPI003F6879C4
MALMSDFSSYSSSQPNCPYALTDEPATGRALRFLLVLLLLWIGGRAIANGVLDGDAPKTPAQQLWEEIDLTVSSPARTDDNANLVAQYQATPSPIKTVSHAVFDNVQKVSQRQRLFAGAALSPDILAGHQLLLWGRSTGGFSSDRTVRALVADSMLAQDFRPGAGVRRAKPGRGNIAKRDIWALDSWVFWRADNAAFGQQTIGGRAQYGGSQAGAIARYYPWASSGAPLLFLRSTASLSGPNQTELALGAAIRPSRKIPLQLIAEQRVTVNGAGSNQPAAYIVSDIPPQKLAGNVRATAYGQAGIVGLKDSAYFFDVQLVAEKPVVQNGQREIAVGAGLWSGGQGPLSSDAENRIARVHRLDIGPRVSTRLPIAGQQTQIALDWRQRVAGNAAPGSGAALTVSTRF